MQIGRHREEAAATAARAHTPAHTHTHTHTHTERRREERRGDATDTPQGAVRWREGEDERRKEGGMERERPHPAVFQPWHQRPKKKERNKERNKTKTTTNQTPGS